MNFPFMALDNDAGRRVASRFIDAVCKNPNRAWSYVSSVYSANLDLAELRGLLSAGSVIQHVKIAAYANVTRNRTMRCVYITRNRQKIMLHLSMVQEQGKWKVFGVEQE